MRFSLVGLTCLAALTADTWTPALSMRLQTVAEVTPSPNGKLVLWTQNLTHIFLARADGSGLVQLTRGRQIGFVGADEDQDEENVYPRTPHGPREPKFVQHVMEQHLDWVEKYLRP